MKTRRSRQSLKVGDKVDAQDTDKKWYEARFSEKFVFFALLWENPPYAQSQRSRQKCVDRSVSEFTTTDGLRGGMSGTRRHLPACKRSTHLRLTGVNSRRTRRLRFGA